jgi:tetratricopeptide (TPR) repeat protein
LLRPQERPSSGVGIDAQIGKGYDLVQKELYLEAAQEFQAALALNPALVRVRYQLGVCYFAIYQFAESRKEFERLLRETAADPSIVYYLGRLDLVEENLDSAISRLNIVASDPPFPDTAYYLGSAYLKKGDLAQAEKWLRKAAELAPRDARVPEHLARINLKTGRRSEAEKLYALAAELRERSHLGNSQAIDCNRALASQPLEQAHAVCRKLFDARDPDKLTFLGMIYGDRQQYAEALEPFEQAARLDPESFEIQYNLALTYFRLKRYSEARTPFERAAALRPEFFGANALLGATLYMLHDDARSYQALGYAHRLNPEEFLSRSRVFRGRNTNGA